MSYEEELATAGLPVLQSAPMQSVVFSEPSIEETVEPVPIASVKQPTKHPSPKIAAVGYGGGFLATVLAWCKARFDLEFTQEDVQLIMLVGTFAAGYFTKDRLGQAIAGRRKR